MHTVNKNNRGMLFEVNSRLSLPSGTFLEASAASIQVASRNILRVVLAPGFLGLNAHEVQESGYGTTGFVVRRPHPAEHSLLAHQRASKAAASCQNFKFRAGNSRGTSRALQ